MATKTKDDTLSLVPFDMIEVGAEGITNPRQSTRDLASLTQSIRTQGLKNPLRVWHKRLGGNSALTVEAKKMYARYILVSGFGRHAAITDIRKTLKTFLVKVPCVLLHGTLEEIRLGQLVEQVQHADWNPMDAADAVISLTTPTVELGAATRTEAPYDMAGVALATGKTPVWLGQIVKVRQKAAPPVVDAIRDKGLPVTEALKWITFDPAKQVELLKQYLSTKGTKGTRAANREAREATETPERPVKPTAKELNGTRGAIGILSTDPYWKGAMDALDWALGRNKKFRPAIAKAVDAIRQKGGRTAEDAKSNGKGKGKNAAQPQA